VARSVPFWETLARAVVAAVAGGLVGWLVFGKLGAALMREAAGKEETEEKDKP
jgi:membrane protein YqaA with SNARE-associated domain